MGSADLVGQAAGELYACDPADFTRRRGELAAQARAAGDRAAAKQIADLRRPTRSAWVVNQLVRADPTAPTRLAALAAEFRAGQTAADGIALRRLSQERHQLIDTLVRQALAASGEHSPSAMLRDEVTATLAAALTDPDVAGQLAAGTLTHARQQAELDLATGLLAPPPAGAPGAPAARQAPAPGQAVHAAAPRQRAQARGERTEQEQAERERAERERAERERAQAVAKAQQVAESARLAAEAAAAAERDQDAVVQRIELDLALARQLQQQARLRTSQAAAAHRNAVQALRRLSR